MPAAACKHTDTMIVRRGTMHDDYFWNFCDVIHDSHVHDDMYVLKLLCMPTLYNALYAV